MQFSRYSERLVVTAAVCLFFLQEAGKMEQWKNKNEGTEGMDNWRGDRKKTCRSRPKGENDISGE
jgi:hypothetical protein